VAPKAVLTSDKALTVLATTAPVLATLSSWGSTSFIWATSIFNSAISQNVFSVAKFTNEQNRQLSKIISLGDDGRLKSDASACFMARGHGRNVAVEGPSDLADLINQLESSEALSLGRIDMAKVNRQPDDVLDVVTARSLREPQDGVIARTAQYLTFQAGEPGFMLFDIDFKGMPSTVAGEIEANGGVLETIYSECPGLKSAGHVERASTSAGILNIETGERFTG